MGHLAQTIEKRVNGKTLIMVDLSKLPHTKKELKRKKENLERKKDLEIFFSKTLPRKAK